MPDLGKRPYTRPAGLSDRIDATLEKLLYGEKEEVVREATDHENKLADRVFDHFNMERGKCVL